jgi:hypothetical protein
MKRLRALAFALISGCATTATGDSRSVDDVLRTPAQFDGQHIRVCGWFVAEMETCTLVWPSSVDEIWIHPRSDVCSPDNWFSAPKSSWAVVEGTFHTGAQYGHLGTYRHAIGGATVTPISGACTSTGSAPNNSFKPKPLRGSA